MRYLLASLALLLGGMAAAATVTLTGPASVPAGAAPTLTWAASDPQATCAASGGWSGALPASGSKAVAAISAATSYQIVCTSPRDTSAILSWTAPTTNTDGTPVNLSGYNLYCDVTDAGLTAQTNGPCVDGSVLNSPTILTYTFTGLATGLHFWKANAWYCDPAGNCAESTFTANVSKTIAAVGASASATLSITVVAPVVKPKAPTGLVAQ